MRILDDNPQKPVVRMANLCVVSSHAVSGAFFELNNMSLTHFTMFLFSVLLCLQSHQLVTILF